MCTSEKRVSVEEQRAQEHDRFLRGRPIADVIYEHFRATGADEAVQSLSDLFRKNAYRMMTFKISIQDGTKLYSHQVKIPTKMVLEGLYNSKSQDSVQLQTVLPLYE